MKNSRSIPVIVLYVITQAVLCVAVLTGENVCHRRETYTVTMRVVVKEPVQVKSYTWCLSVPPRCTKYRIEMRDKYKVQTELRERVVDGCCAGYSMDRSETLCVPHCNSCVYGVCVTPDICYCEPGYTGDHCEKECGKGFWGSACLNECRCHNDTTCNHVTGDCKCGDGWRGTLCDDKCPAGTYGQGCLKKCNCTSHSNCHHVSGNCIDNPEVILDLKTNDNDNTFQLSAALPSDNTKTTGNEQSDLDSGISENVTQTQNKTDSEVITPVIPTSSSAAATARHDTVSHQTTGVAGSFPYVTTPITTQNTSTAISTPTTIILPSTTATSITTATITPTTTTTTTTTTPTATTTTTTTTPTTTSTSITIILPSTTATTTTTTTIPTTTVDATYETLNIDNDNVPSTDNYKDNANDLDSDQNASSSEGIEEEPEEESTDEPQNIQIPPSRGIIVVSDGLRRSEDEAEVSKEGMWNLVSSVSVAGGVALVFIVLAIITLMVSHRRNKIKVANAEKDAANYRKHQQQSSGPQMYNYTEDVTTLPLRHLFPDTVFHPPSDDASPTEALQLRFGDISSPTTPDRSFSSSCQPYTDMRAYLELQYDIPPSSLSSKTNSFLPGPEPEHLYDEIPCWRSTATTSTNTDTDTSHC